MAGDFHNELLPTSISFGTTGGPMRKTEIAMLGSGFEERNAIWAGSRRKYNAGYGLRHIGEKELDDVSLHNIERVLAFFEARNGRLHSFKFKDWSDYKSCSPLKTPSATDQLIGTGDGATTTFQLKKTYGDDSGSWERTILLPKADTTKIAFDGVEQPASRFSVDLLTGLVTINSPPPVYPAVVTAGFEFYVPVRFDTDHLAINLAAWEAGEIPDVPLIEVRLR